MSGPSEAALAAWLEAEEEVADEILDKQERTTTTEEEAA